MGSDAETTLERVSRHEPLSFSHDHLGSQHGLGIAEKKTMVSSDEISSPTYLSQGYGGQGNGEDDGRTHGDGVGSCYSPCLAVER